jgi:7-cyano-7-deazaguanine synthase
LLGLELGVPFGETWSCYRGGLKPCGTCDSCLLRAKAFGDAGIEDPALALNQIE